MVLVRPQMKKQRGSQGRERWLSAAEIEIARASSPPEWWPLFAVLIYTGLRMGEAQGARWADIRLTDQLIAIHEGFRRRKTRSSDRDVPIPEPLAEVMAVHPVRVPNGPTDLVFPGELGDYGGARRAWRRICVVGGLAKCRIHDLRHTFGVHAARSGVPLVRLQRLMGHSTPTMTLRYMRQAPDGDFASDAARVADSMNPNRLDESTGARRGRSHIRRA